MKVIFLEAATSVPKKRKNMKEFNKKEAIGDLLDAFTEVCISLDDFKCLDCIHSIFKGLL